MGQRWERSGLAGTLWVLRGSFEERKGLGDGCCRAPGLEPGHAFKLKHYSTVQGKDGTVVGSKSMANSGTPTGITPDLPPHRLTQKHTLHPLILCMPLTFSFHRHRHHSRPPFSLNSSQKQHVSFVPGASYSPVLLISTSLSTLLSNQTSTNFISSV